MWVSLPEGPTRPSPGSRERERHARVPRRSAYGRAAVRWGPHLGSELNPLTRRHWTEAVGFQRAGWYNNPTRKGVNSMGAVTIELPAELLALLGSEEEARRGAKVALVLDLVRRGKLSRAKAAELLQMPLADLPDLLAQYRIPWFDYPPEDLRRDLETLRQREGTRG